MKTVKADPSYATHGSVRTAVNELLETYFAQRIELADTMAGPYGDLWRSMAELSRSGGKRLRPYMVVLGYECFGGKDREHILPVAAAWELLHLCLLIHDDIIDNDLVRYGVNNVAGQYHERYGGFAVPPERRAHLATSAALLAGDLAQSAAHDLVLSSQLQGAEKLLSQQYLTAATFTVAGGELLDTESVLRPIAEADPLAIARYKTASYSFVGPLCNGAALAGASAAVLEQLEAFGSALGTAFQLADDLLGVFGDEALTGKSNLGDLREGKPTYLMQYALAHAAPDDQKTLHRHVGDPDLTAAQAETVRAILVGCGARQAMEDLVADYRQRCHGLVETMQVEGPCRQGLLDLIAAATRRNH